MRNEAKELLLCGSATSESISDYEMEIETIDKKITSLTMQIEELITRRKLLFNAIDNVYIRENER